MLTADENLLLTQTGAGTPMGELLRRYWWPIGAVDELDRCGTMPVRVLGEDLVAYRDLDGAYGLLGRHCRHRRADLVFGIREHGGLRCSYHGWCYDAAGQCIDQPYEQGTGPKERFAAQATTTAYPLRARAGVLWAYLGPQPAPVLWNWEPYGWEHCFRQIVISEVPCNWLQAQENSIDPIHFEWLHENWNGGRTPPAAAPRHLKIDFQEFEWGFTYRRVREGGSEADELWTVGRVCLWPNCLFTTDHFEWRTPIDDTNMLSVTLAWERVPEDREPFRQDVIPSWHGPLRDARGEWIVSHVMNQDFAAWVGQGPIADRTKELIGPADRGIAMIRRQLLRDLDVVASGANPKSVYFADDDAPIELPYVRPQVFTRPRPRADFDARRTMFARMGFDSAYPFQAGQPDTVRTLYGTAMGADPSD
jgi:5,5'-dehydrodivanillate O-demethylase oxygenase subunit